MQSAAGDRMPACLIPQESPTPTALIQLFGLLAKAFSHFSKLSNSFTSRGQEAASNGRKLKESGEGRCSTSDNGRALSVDSVLLFVALMMMSRELQPELRSFHCCSISVTWPAACRLPSGTNKVAAFTLPVPGSVTPVTSQPLRKQGPQKRPRHQQHYKQIQPSQLA